MEKIEDINIRSVRFSVAVDAKFDKVAQKLGRTKRSVFVQMVDYFYKSKKDPLDLNDELLKNSLVKNHQQYIGFIKAQENMLLLPIKAEMDRVSRSQRDIIERFNSDILKHNAIVLAGQKSVGSSLGDTRVAIEQLVNKSKDADVLKAQFLFLFEQYISLRENMGVMTSAKEKLDLAEKIKDQIRLL